MVMKFSGIKSVGIERQGEKMTVGVVHMRGRWSGEFDKVELTVYREHGKFVLIDKMPQKVVLYDALTVEITDSGGVTVIV